jgi:hypothetical protein
MPKNSILAIIGWFLALSPEVVAEVTERDFFPLHFGREITDSSGTRIDEDWLWPFGRFEQDTGKETWSGAARPLFSWGGDFEDERFFRVLPPIGLFNWSDDEIDRRIQPFWYYRWKVFGDGSEKLNATLFPFFSWDRDRDDPSRQYSIFYGHILNKYGVDEAEYWMLPLYLKTRRGEFVNRNFLVPIFGFGSGGGGSNFRIWPLYGHKIVPGKKDSLFILWPFYGHSMAYDEEGDIVETWGSFPLYTKIESPRRHGWSFLWPFFESQSVNRPRRQYEKRALPFPFNQRITDTRLDANGNRIGGQDTRIYFPFYGHIQKDSERRRLDAEYWSPLFWRIDKSRTERFSSSERILFPFVWLKTTDWVSRSYPSHDFKLWPLWNYQEPEEGGHHFRLFDPFWFRRGKDMDRHYSVLYTLYERERDRYGYGYDHFLGKSIYHAEYEDYSRTNILHLIQFFDTPQDGRGLSLARGLIGWSATDAGSQWRLFWLRFGGR